MSTTDSHGTQQKMNVNRNRLFTIISVLAALFLTVACAPIIPANTSSGTAQNSEQTMVPSEGDATQMPTSLPTPADAGLQKVIELAKTDLANRLTTSTEDISLIEVTEVEWSDSSLDCPQPGMEYLQVITPGYRIRLAAGGQEYEYHADRGTLVVFCGNQILQ